jgi:hypothetical protein
MSYADDCKDCAGPQVHDDSPVIGSAKSVQSLEFTRQRFDVALAGLSETRHGRTDAASDSFIELRHVALGWRGPAHFTIHKPSF